MAEQSILESRRAWSIVGFLAVAFIINYVDRQVVFSIFPLLRRDLSFTDAQLGLAGSLFTWTYSLAMPLTGRLADIFPRGRLIVVALALWSLATLCTGLSLSIGQFFLCRIAMGLSESLYVPAAISLLTQAHPGRTRSRALSIHGFAQYIGITLGGWYGGWAGDHIGWRQGFWGLAVVGLLYSVVLARGFRHLNLAAVKPKGPALSPRLIVESRCYIALSALFFSFCAMLWILYAWLPNFIYERYGLSLTQSGLTATIYLQASSAAGVLSGGLLGDFLTRRYPSGRFLVAAGGVFCCAPFAFATLETHSLVLMKLSACGFGFFAGLFMANAFSSPYDVIAPRNFAFAAGVMNAIGGLGAGAAILIAGISKQSIGIERLMFWTVALSMTLAVALFFVVRARFAEERERAAADR